MNKTALLLAFAGLATAGFLAGCSGDAHQRQRIESTAGDSRQNYARLASRIDTDLGKLQAADNAPGTPSQYRDIVREVASDLRSLIADADAVACDMRDANEARIAHLNTDAAEHADRTDTGNAATRALGLDAASRQASRIEKLRDYQNTFCEDASKLRLALEKARGNLSDIDNALSANLEDETVRLTKGALGKAIAALKDAKSDIRSLQDDIVKIRDYQPQSIGR